MIVIKNNFLPDKVFKDLQDYVYSNRFSLTKVGEKTFYILPTPDFIIPYLQIKGYDALFSFIRKANNEINTEMNVHADNIINGKPTHLASVLYINESDSVSPNGTAFWEHEKYGLELPENTPNEEFDRLLLEDSNNIHKWRQHIFVPAIPNRLLTYQANLFHSKFPAKIQKGERIVLVVFFNKEVK